jgi:hypothetical protein
MIGQGIGFTGMEGSWTQKESVYIEKSMTKTPFPLMPLEAHHRMLKRGGSIPKERRTSSHVPLGMMNTQDEHEPHQAPNRVNSGFPWKGRNFLIETVREERKGRQTACLR